MWHFKYTLLWLLLISTVTISARSIPSINAEKAHEAARQQVVWRNRVCPLATLANDFLESIYGKTSYKGLSSVQVLYGWHLRPDVWKDEPMILIPDSNLRHQLGIEGEYAKFSELFDDTLGYRLNSLGADLPEKMRQMVRESAPVIELDEKVGMIILLTQGKLITPRPEKMEPLSPWRVEAEILYNDVPFYMFLLIVGLFISIILICRFFRKRGVMGRRLA
jgi:hypothetical protein